uniref:Alternative protein ZKSCAN5 n=1 Tax=Homo sapiens TaxID=9606 RepID=L8EAP2_HUMAN|nr:alternative protein ZKSCAN5 [Homo sapiens]
MPNKYLLTICVVHCGALSSPLYQAETPIPSCSEFGLQVLTALVLQKLENCPQEMRAISPHPGVTSSLHPNTWFI